MSEDCQIRPDGIEAFPLWDQAWMRASCRGPKAGVGDSGQRLASGAQLSVRAGGEDRLPQDQEDHSAWLRERLLETQI